MWLTELRSCVKVEVAAQVSPSIIVLTVCVDVKQHQEKKKKKKCSLLHTDEHKSEQFTS